MDAKRWEQSVNLSLRNIRLDTRIRCSIEENSKGNRWRIRLVDSSHDTSFTETGWLGGESCMRGARTPYSGMLVTETGWLGGESCMRVIDGMEMVFMHLASRETFFQEVGQQYADILGLKPSEEL
jgi:hypothetical protein